MKIFELEQNIMNCWDVVESVKDLEWFITNDTRFIELKPEHCDLICNILSGMHHLYQLRFEKMFDIFESHCAEYHALRVKGGEQ